MNTDNTVDKLVDAMTATWEGYGNTPTTELQRSWRQAFTTFERKVAEHGTTFSRDWWILSPATGTGKSVGLKVYAANTLDNAPGIIIVVRLISQADEFVRDINAMAGKQIAIAKHSQAADVNLESLRDYPVLVITHAAFTGQAQRDHELWAYYSAFGNAKRKLVVVDEALDILEISRVQSESIERILDVVPNKAWEKWPLAQSSLNNLLQVIETRKATNEPTQRANLLNPAETYGDLQDPQEAWEGIDQLEELRAWLKSDQHRYLWGRKLTEDEDPELRQKARHDNILKELIAVYSSFIVHSMEGKRHTFSTARSLLPDEGQGCVVMDATADSNAIYDCMAHGSMAIHKEQPIRCRNYGNATLKVSVGHSVGRNALVKPNAAGKMPIDDEAPKLIAALIKDHNKRADTSCPMEKVLIVCHKDAVPALQGYDTPFEYDVGHYGALDGRNCWRDFDSVVIYGIDYRHPTDPGVSFIALQGENQLDPFGDAAGRSFGGHEDIVKAIEQGWIISSLIQAINRIRTRKVIDAEGNCPESYVYLAVPDNHLGKSIRKAVIQQMPNIKIEGWDPKIRKAPARSEYVRSLEALINQMVPGEAYSATQLKQQLSIPAKAWERIPPKLKDETTSIAQLMADKNVVYEVTGRGRRRYAKLRCV